MGNLFHTHYANHSDKTCPKFLNSLKEILLPQEPLRMDEKQYEKEKEGIEEEEEAKPSSNLHLVWDATKMDEIDDDVMEDMCVGNDYNLQSKGVFKSSYFPHFSKTSAKKDSAATTSTKNSLEKAKDSGKDPTAIKSTTSMDLT